MVPLIAEVWDLFRLSNDLLCFGQKIVFCINFSLLDSPWYSLSSPGAPLDRGKKA